MGVCNNMITNMIKTSINYASIPLNIQKLCDTTNISHIKYSRPELDSELLDDRTKVLGVLAADNDGMCLMGK